ncbi:MAG: peptide ligase PGM1-related protein [Prochloraceae cyanobacterium]|nr:peptide ligase PGM1-related protein [Prochloraceae cyanobacterium]
MLPDLGACGSSYSDRFEQLQSQLNQDPLGLNLFETKSCDILVIPSLSIDIGVAEKISGLVHYEERLLFSLIHLRNPDSRVIYVSAIPLCPLIIDYYLHLLPGIPLSHARDRLILISTYDNSSQPLTKKILERPRLIERIKRALRPGKSYMVCYNSTVLEQELSLKLEIPLLAASPRLLYWGSKSGSREIFAEAKIPHPDGSIKLACVDDLILAATSLWERQPNLKRMVVKLNEGFSGEGNAILDLQAIKDYAPGLASHSQRLITIKNCLSDLRFQAPEETWEKFSAKLVKLGGIVEAFIEGDNKRSPSFQGYITPKGEVEALSTHDQILGGPDGQIYLGCRFPAAESYRLQIQEMGLSVGMALARKGAIASYGVDFIAVPNSDNSWEIQALEINLRQGGTTHPFMTLKLLTSGSYNCQTGLFYTQENRAKYYIASDNLQKEIYKGLLPQDLMDIIATHNLHFDTSHKTGCVFHLIGALSQYGKIGLTCIGNSWQEAENLYDRVERILDCESQIDFNNNSAPLSSQFLSLP